MSALADGRMIIIHEDPGPAGGLVFCASTPTDSRAVRNARTQLRKAGLDLTQRNKRN